MSDIAFIASDGKLNYMQEGARQIDNIVISATLDESGEPTGLLIRLLHDVKSGQPLQEFLRLDFINGAYTLRRDLSEFLKKFIAIQQRLDRSVSA